MNFETEQFGTSKNVGKTPKTGGSSFKSTIK